jgi:hypothetical protein
MSNKNKYLFILIILAFIGYQFYLIVNDFSSTRIIQVQKEIYESKEKDYFKNYDIENAPFEQFDIKVSPKTFWDYLLLTNEDGNLLSIILTVMGSLCFAWYIFKLEPATLFDEKYFKWLILSIGFAAFVFIAADSGFWHTSYFWKNSIKDKTDYWKHNFYINGKNHLMFYAWGCVISMTFLRTVVDYNKPATIKFKREN